MNTALRDKSVLITGASGGIGLVTSRAFAAEGTRLLLHYHNQPGPLQALRAELAKPVTLLQADLRDEQQTCRMFEQALAAQPRIDCVVINAGIWPPTDTPLHEMSLEQWRNTIDADLTSAFLTCRAFLQHVARVPREAASIVLIGSTAALFGEAGHADYSAAKAALTYGLTRTLKNEIMQLCPRGRVNCVSPGWTDTPMSAAYIADPAAVAKATATIAMRKIARAEDVAAAVVFLSSDALAGHISGAILPVTGGMEGRLLHSENPDPLSSGLR